LLVVEADQILHFAVSVDATSQTKKSDCLLLLVNSFVLADGFTMAGSLCFWAALIRQATFTYVTALLIKRAILQQQLIAI